MDQLGFDGYIIIPDTASYDKPLKNIPIHTTRTLSMEGSIPVNSKLNNIWNTIKNEKLGIDSVKKKNNRTKHYYLVPGKRERQKSRFRDRKHHWYILRYINLYHPDVVWFPGNDGCNGRKNKPDR
jgi:hypothetical protein